MTINSIKLDGYALEQSVAALRADPFLNTDEVTVHHAEVIIREYLSWCNSSDRDFSDEMLKARAEFQKRCDADPNECPQAIWEELAPTKLASTANEGW